MSDLPSVDCIAAFAPVQFPVKQGKDNWRLTIDVPTAQIGQAAGLLAYLENHTFRLRVDPDPADRTMYGSGESDPTEQPPPLKRRSAKRRV